MARQCRQILVGHNYFHVVVQGNAKEYIFAKDEWKGYFLSCMRDFKKKFSIKIFAFCVMDNHAHVLLYTPSLEDLSKFCKSVNESFATYYNRINERVGHVFRDRFKAQVIKNDKQLAYCLAYIHNNPIKAEMVDRVEDYEYSSITNYLRKTGIVDFEEAAKHYDISIENIITLSQERTNYKWIDCFDRLSAIEVEKRFADLVLEYDIKIEGVVKPQKFDEFVDKLQSRLGISLREIALRLKVNREVMRKWTKENS